MSRAKWKGPVFNKNFYGKLNSSTRFITWSKKNCFRNFTIPSSVCNKRIYTYNGHLFRKVNIVQEKIGFKFGDFSYTRKHNPPKKLKKKSNKK